MVELEQEMDVDSHPVVPPQESKSSQPWELSTFRDTITASFLQMLDPIRQVVREECSSAITHEQREQKRPGPDHAVKIRELEDQLMESKAETNSLLDQVDLLKEDIAQAKLAVNERDAKNKKLQRVIIESSQNVTPPMDNEIITLFNQLNHDIMKIVKKHFTKPFRSAEVAINTWKGFQALSPENKELWVRAFIADELYAAFFGRRRKVFGLDSKREDAMKGFEQMLEDSHKVSEADIIDWRIRTVSCAQKLGLARGCRNLAYDTVQDLRFMGPQKLNEQKDAEETMEAIYDRARDIAILFRSNTVSYSWLQIKPASSIPMSESEIIGSTNTRRPAELYVPEKIIFGGAVKNQKLEEDRVVLTKTELVVK